MSLDRRQLDRSTHRHIQLYLTTTATTPNQALADPYTVPNGKKLIILEGYVEVRKTAPEATLELLGDMSLRWGTAVIKGPITAVNPNSGAPFGFPFSYPEGLSFEGDGSKTLNAVCSPSTAASIKWVIDLTCVEIS